MYKCPRCNLSLFQKSYVHKTYCCMNSNCVAMQYGSEFSQAYCDRFLTGGSEVKEVRVTPLFDGEMYELWFPLNHARRGYFKEAIQPVVDIIKAKVPITAREYNPDSKHWTLTKEYYIPIIEIMKAMKFTVTVHDVAKQNAPNVDVPKDYEENFYRSEAKPSAIFEDISAKLATMLNMEAVELLTADELKTEYRKACRKYHPDLGGDAEKMSELNRLWSLYNAS